MPNQTESGYPGCPLVTLPFNPSTLLISCVAVSLSLEVYSFSFSLTVGISCYSSLFFFFAASAAALLAVVRRPFCFSVHHRFAGSHSLLRRAAVRLTAPATIDDSKYEGTVEFLRSGQ
ncbi:hypothetical protein M9H77_32014 [Catharanthus roseus]|uniref:Uncharacterized protein n=1 Tax=Catharanthus roseus TaxID=4058 RepID=A0ACC0A4D2_CATRO|nr:hypothetical protein M9H77_32014 [Catharanthus roseus]